MCGMWKKWTLLCRCTPPSSTPPAFGTSRWTMHILFFVQCNIMTSYVTLNYKGWMNRGLVCIVILWIRRKSHHCWIFGILYDCSYCAKLIWLAWALRSNYLWMYAFFGPHRCSQVLPGNQQQPCSSAAPLTTRSGSGRQTMARHRSTYPSARWVSPLVLMMTPQTHIFPTYFTKRDVTFQSWHVKKKNAHCEICMLVNSVDTSYEQGVFSFTLMTIVIAVSHERHQTYMQLIRIRKCCSIDKL